MPLDIDPIDALREENRKLKEEVRRLRAAFSLGMGRVRPTGEGVSGLENGFPHIAARLVAFWGTDELPPYVESLVTNQGGERQGFPFDTLQEIMLLKSVHEAAYPQIKGWTEEHSRW